MPKFKLFSALYRNISSAFGALCYPLVFTRNLLYAMNLLLLNQEPLYPLL
jgi:hypothetical protein